ncbi:MAG: hypothetical protein RLZZ447_2145 [Verrucomicrobiota bacterium]|jgi:hypothetical protein
MSALRLLFLLCVASAAAAAPAPEFSLVRVWPGWKEAEDFTRLREYFGATPDSGPRRVLRTSPDQRAGFYFLVRTRGPAVPAAVFELAVLRPDRPEPVTHRFPAPRRAGEEVLELGLTGDAWPGGKRAQPVAWRLRVLDAGDRLLAEERSFLWADPVP